MDSITDKTEASYIEDRDERVDSSAASSKGIGHYLATRVTTLKPPMHTAANPFELLGSLSRQQWLFFWVAFAAWAWDAFDFFTVSLTVTSLAKDFHKSNSEITWGITLVLMFRSVGAVIFGLLSDRFGRKWPFIMNNILFIAFELATGFCPNYSSFLACRALFGIAMGGLYGNAVATALEGSPAQAHGILSGLFQAGYPAGYLLATAFSRGLVNTTGHGWRPLFWFGACPPVLIIVFRLCLPESQTFRERERERRSMRSARSAFLQEAKLAIKCHWLTLIFMVLLMAGFNFMAHGSQDFYPTLLANQFQFSATDVTITQVIANLGAMSGAIVVGYASEIFGRRFSIMVSCLIGGALLYPYTYTSTLAVAAPAFFVQFFVQGAFGVIPIHLMELSPGLRAFVVGTAYQLGNLASSPAATIQSEIGERYYPLPPTKTGTKRYNYGLVICAFEGACFVLVLLLTFLGPEKKGQQFGKREDVVGPGSSAKENAESEAGVHAETV